ncbi:MAG: hypothetical protein K0R54_1057 [Clostridiaceae bacterium]|jgi:hypothetical protein|nr:hypothetical protein [Clostridiaceae bacterium]
MHLLKIWLNIVLNSLKCIFLIFIYFCISAALNLKGNRILFLVASNIIMIFLILSASTLIKKNLKGTLLKKTWL